ncbi:MAG: DUF4625 domain-containing protein, partial [Oscillospiraceae bacterium]|nr:DUF4625 domain-containing protein [Oscillospiraceae bacterium]
MKKLTGYLLALIFVVASCIPVVAAGSNDEDKDTQPPTFSSITLDKKLARPGDTIVVSADAVDDDSGVKSVTATFTHSDGNKSYPATLLLKSDPDIKEEFSGLLEIPADAPAGLYRLTRVALKDRENNAALYSAAYQEWDKSRGLFPLEHALSFTVGQAGTAPEPARCAVSEKNG